MLKVFSHEDRFLVWQIKHQLEHKGIPCFVKNEYAIGGVGDLSPFDSWPEVWITDEEWLTQAEKVIQQHQTQKTKGVAWICAHCGERNADNFEICWQCQQEPERSS